MSIPFPICRAAVAALIVAVASPSWAADPLTLAQAQRIAVDRSQQLVAQDALSNAAREQAVAAGQLPDPVLKLGIDNLPINGSDRFSLTSDFMTQRRIGVMQEIPRSEKRQLAASASNAKRSAPARSGVHRSRSSATRRWPGWTATTPRPGRKLMSSRSQSSRLAGAGRRQRLIAAGRGSQADVFAARAARA